MISQHFLMASKSLFKQKYQHCNVTLITTTVIVFSNKSFGMRWVLISNICSKTLLVGKVYPSTISSNNKEAPWLSKLRMSVNLLGQKTLLVLRKQLNYEYLMHTTLKTDIVLIIRKCRCQYIEILHQICYLLYLQAWQLNMKIKIQLQQ